MPQGTHRWTFVRSSGIHQVQLSSGADVSNLGQLDQKLWVALGCPTHGLHLDTRTLALLDGDGDGRLRAPDIIAASAWVTSLLKHPDGLWKGDSCLPLNTLRTDTEEGRRLEASARQILKDLGKPEATSLSVEDVSDTQRIFAGTRFNGDGVLPAEACDTEEERTLVREVGACLGTRPDRSGQPGVDPQTLATFFQQAESYLAWWNEGHAQPQRLPCGEHSESAYQALEAVRAKVDDFFTRCQLVGFDPRSQAAMSRSPDEYLEVASHQLSPDAPELLDFPLALVEQDKPLPLAKGVNPAWAAKVEALRRQVVVPLLGAREELSREEWEMLKERFHAYHAWWATKPAVAVEQLGPKRLAEWVASGLEARVRALLDQDLALRQQAEDITAVEKLVRLYRDLGTLLRNFVSFEQFYERKQPAIFQAGTLYLDERSCELTLWVEDVAAHAAMAAGSRMCLAYCELSRQDSPAPRHLVAAFTGGDSDYLAVGRHGVFYDRQGRDWHARIVKLVDNPISVPQAFWTPYKKALRFVEQQLEKFGAAKEQSVEEAAARAAREGAEGKKDSLDLTRFAGIFAAIGLALGLIGGALAGLLSAFAQLAWWQMPLAVLGLLLVVSGPSMLIAALKLRQRNLAPLLDANGWAINVRARVNIPLGSSLTQVATLPRGARRQRKDPFAPRRAGLHIATAAVLLALVLGGLWYLGLLPRVAPKLIRVEAAGATAAP